MQAGVALSPQPFGRRQTRRPMLQSLRQSGSVAPRQQNPVTVVGGSGTVQGASPSATTVQFSPNQQWQWWAPWWGSWGWGWGAPYSSVYYGVPAYSYAWPYGYDYDVCAAYPWAQGCQYPYPSPYPPYPWSGWGYGW